MREISDEKRFAFTPDMNRKYYFIPFTVPEDVETMYIEFSYDSNKRLQKDLRNYLDIGLVLPDGNQLGAANPEDKRIVISERYSTHGYRPITPVAGEWQLLIGVAGCEERGGEAIFRFVYALKEPRWLSGDCHLHTYHSDGAHSPEKLVAKLKKKKLDYAIITDHKVNMTGAYYRFWDPRLLVINGYELTSYNGHVNLWGVKEPLDLPFAYNDMAGYMRLYEQARERGCTVSINHLTCKNCGWHFWETPTEEQDKRAEERVLPEGVQFDCCEVWNGPMRIDNMTAIGWWHNQLLKGARLPAVGGSDYHSDYVVTDLLASPTTVVYARSNTTEDVLAALRAGHSFITHSPKSTRMYLTVGDAICGDSVRWSAGIKAKLRLENTKAGHRLVIYNNYNRMLDVRLKHKKVCEYEVELPEAGFVRAEILYNYNFVTKTIYKMMMPILMPKDVGLTIPMFCWAMTNPIWLEK